MTVQAFLSSDPDELIKIREIVSAAFGDVFDNSDPSAVARMPELSIGVRSDGRLLGGCFTLAMDLALPGGAQLGSAALAAVGVDPSATGLGAMTAMLNLHLSESRRLGLATSILTASETGLYPRYGYGPISTVCRYQVDLNRASLVTDAPTGNGSVRLLLDSTEARSTLEHVHCLTETRSGMTNRSPAIWDIVLAEKPNYTGGGQRFVAAHFPAGSKVADGCAIYSVSHPDHDFYLPAGVVQLDELVSASTEAELSLWNYLVSIPLARTLSWIHAPVDPVVSHYMVDERQLAQTRRVDNLWMRILDVERVLLARSYNADGQVDFYLKDPLFETQTGVYRLVVRGGVASVKVDRSAGPVESVPEITIGQLASVLMGEHRMADLARSGCVRGSADDLAGLDRLFLVDQAPFSLTRF